VREGEVTRICTRTPVRAVGLVVAAAFLALPAAASAQQGGGASGGGQEAATPAPGADSLVQYRREVFHYPTGRRNPFTPVRAGEQLGPRFEDLELSGVIFNERLGSVAVLVDRTTGKRYRVHQGERVGQARVARISPDEVSFVVSGFGQSRTEVLRVKKKDKETSG